MKFAVGRILQTKAVYETGKENATFYRQVMESLAKYMQCDWGDSGIDDSARNDRAVKKKDDRIVASYETTEGKLFIITEWDRSYTTVMFAEEY